MKKNIFCLVFIVLNGLVCFSQGYLEIKDGKVYVRNTEPSKNMATRVLEKRISTGPSPLVNLSMESRAFEIRTWDSAQVKLMVVVNVDSTVRTTDEALWNKSGIIITGSKDEVQVFAKRQESGSSGPVVFNSGGTGNIEEMNSKINQIGSPSGNTSTSSNTLTNLEELNLQLNQAINKIKPTRRKLEGVLYVPKNAKLMVKSKYATLDMISPLGQVEIEADNSSIYTSDVEELRFNGKFSSVNSKNITRAIIESEHVEISARKINSISFYSRSTSFTADEVDTVLIRQSQNDNYSIASLKHASGKKDFGSFEVGGLGGRLSLKGTSFALTIRSVLSSVDSIVIEDKFADLRLPLNESSTYRLDVKGENLVYYLPEFFADNGRPFPDKPNYIQKLLGNPSGKIIVLQLTCPSCIIDFR